MKEVAQVGATLLDWRPLALRPGGSPDLKCWIAIRQVGIMWQACANVMIEGQWTLSCQQIARGQQRIKRSVRRHHVSQNALRLRLVVGFLVRLEKPIDR